MTKIVAMAILLALNVAAVAESKLVILGAGTEACEQVASAQEADQGILMSWILGYISATNVADYAQGRNPLVIRERVQPEPTLLLWLRNYCRENPSRSLADAARQLVIELPRIP